MLGICFGNSTIAINGQTGSASLRGEIWKRKFHNDTAADYFICTRNAYPGPGDSPARSAREGRQMRGELFRVQLIAMAIILITSLLWAFAEWQDRAFKACLARTSYETCIVTFN